MTDLLKREPQSRITSLPWLRAKLLALVSTATAAARSLLGRVKLGQQEQPEDPKTIGEPTVESETRHQDQAQEQITIPAVSSTAKSRRSKTQTAPDRKTFSDLLDRIDDVFDAAKMPEISGNWLSHREVQALYKLGIYVRDDWVLEVQQAPTLPLNTSLPAMASCHLLQSKYDESGHVHPRFAFAIRQPRLPNGVVPTRGTPYKYGLAIPQSENGDGPLRMFWVWGWLVVKPDGSINMPLQRVSRFHTVRHRRASANGRTSVVHQNSWEKQAIEVGFEWKEQEKLVASIFRQLILWWNSRNERWSVGLRKDGARATFSIAPEHTAAYFKDRHKTVNQGGRPKKIIHFVKEHVRENGSTVKAHVRGLSSFEWRGFHCSVTAPKLLGGITTNVPIAPIEVAREEESNGEYMDVLALARHVADAEDRLRIH